EAMEIFEKYKDNLLCVISDVKFPYGGKIDEEAGIKLLTRVKQEYSDMPFLLQSSESTFQAVAMKNGAAFINKNSETLSEDLTDFVLNNLGFCDFIFRDQKGFEISHATSMEEF